MKDYIYGWQPVCEALKKRPQLIETVFFCQELSDNYKKRLLSLCKQQAIPAKSRPLDYFNRLYKTGRKIVHQGVMARLKSFNYALLEDILKQQPQILLVLDHIQDPQNFGNIIRTAASLGVDGIIIPKDRACQVTPTVIKASAGTVFHIPIVRVTNLSKTIEFLKNSHFWIVGTVVSEGSPPWEIPTDVPLAIVVGNEHKGLSRLIKEKCDFLVTIPLNPAINSLNVGIATAICLYEIWKQRLKL